MKMLSYYVTYFIAMSILGYIYETCAMTLWSGKWENRGFLYGPVIPIYGVGSLLATILFTNVMDSYTPTLVFFIGFLGSAILEFPTSVILEKLFHAYWWDYSSAPFNIQGRVSLFSSMGFGIAAIIIVYFINPIVLPYLFRINATIIELISLLSIMLITADATFTVSVLTDFENRVNDLQNMINERMEYQVESINPNGKNIKDALIHTKENIIDGGINHLSNSMNSVYHSAISRIRSFKDSGSETIHMIKDEIKKQGAKLRNKDER